MNDTTTIHPCHLHNHRCPALQPWIMGETIQASSDDIEPCSITQNTIKLLNLNNIRYPILTNAHSTITHHSGSISRNISGIIIHYQFESMVMEYHDTLKSILHE